MCDVTQSWCLLTAGQVGFIYHEIVPSVHAGCVFYQWECSDELETPGYSGVLCSYTHSTFSSYLIFPCHFSLWHSHILGCLCVFFCISIFVFSTPPSLCYPVASSTSWWCYHPNCESKPPRCLILPRNAHSNVTITCRMFFIIIIIDSQVVLYLSCSMWIHKYLICSQLLKMRGCRDLKAKGINWRLWRSWWCHWVLSVLSCVFVCIRGWGWVHTYHFRVSRWCFYIFVQHCCICCQQTNGPDCLFYLSHFIKRSSVLSRVWTRHTEHAWSLLTDLGKLKKATF